MQHINQDISLLISQFVLNELALMAAAVICRLDTLQVGGQSIVSQHDVEGITARLPTQKTLKAVAITSIKSAFVVGIC